MTNDSEKEIGDVNLSLALILNGILCVALIYGWFLSTEGLAQCISYYYRVIPQSIAIFLLVLLFSPYIKDGKVEFGIINLAIDPQLFATLSIPIKVKWIMICLFMLFVALSAFFVFAPISSFRTAQTAPIITGFDITNRSTGQTKTIEPNSKIDLNNPIHVKAHITDGNENTCKWVASIGSITIKKCEVDYAPINGGVDVLTLTVQSTCGPLETSANIFVH